jgi:ABC-type glycerol-3-phosphate transport system substrate-binding protein
MKGGEGNRKKYTYWCWVFSSVSFEKEEEKMARERMTRRRFLAKAAAAATGLAILGLGVQCGPTPTPEVIKELVEKEVTKVVEKIVERPVETTKVIFWPRGATDEEVFVRMLPIARKMFPEIDVVFETPPEKVYEKLRVAMAGGVAPDSSVMNTPNGVPMIGQGAFLSLEPFLDREAEVRENSSL